MQTHYYLLVLALSVSASAQSSPATEETERLVITGTRTAKLLSDSPVYVEVISGETIAKISQGTLVQALNFIPGIVVKRSVKDGYNIQMQGFDADHVLVLIDGQAIISPTGSSADLDQIPASNIEQIEVIRGAASVMYGSSAMGGVINIISKKTDEASLKIDYTASQYHGNTIDDGDINHTFKINANGHIAGWTSQVNVLIIDDKGFDYDSTNVSQDAAQVEKKFMIANASKDFQTISTHIKYQLLDEFKRRDSSKIPGQDQVIFYQTDVNQQQFELGLKDIATPSSPWQLNSRYITHQETSGQSNSIRNTEILLAEINGQKVFQFNNLELVGGGVIHFDKLDQFKPVDNVVEVNNESRASAELFLQSNWKIKDHQVLAGVRSQYDNDFSWHNALRLSTLIDFSFDHSTVQLRSGLGQSYRVPNLKERFYVFDHSALGYMVLGNQTLTPETANSFNANLSLDTSLANNSLDFNSSLSIHYSDTKDLIDSVIDPTQSAEQNLAIYQYQNISQAKIHGFDVSAQLKANQWQMQFNYSYLSSEDDNKRRLLGRPRHQVKLNFNYEFNDYDIELITYAVYQADEATPDEYLGVENNEYFTVNTVLNQRINEQISWRFSIDNLLNEHKSSRANSQQLFDVRPVSSRTFSVGMSYQF